MSVRNIIAIFNREFRSYFVSPIAYAVIALFLVIAGYFFYIMLYQFLDWAFRYTMQAQQYRMAPPKLNVNQLVIRGLMHNFGLIMLFIVPAITMKLFAEEKKTGTTELLLTSPLTTTQIVLGKFFAGFGLLLAMIAPTILYMLIIKSLLMSGDLLSCCYSGSLDGQVLQVQRLARFCRICRLLIISMILRKV